MLEVLRSGWLTSGKKCEALEREMDRVTGRKSFAVTSATLGFQSLLLSLGVGPGWKVCFPGVTFSGIPMQALLTGATIQLVDIDDDGFMVLPPDWKPSEKQMVVPTHLAGAVCPLEDIRAQAGNAIVVEDCAHLYPGFHSGSYVSGACAESDFCIFSFYPTKCVAAAEGGAVTMAKPRPLNTVRLHGFDRVASELYRASGTKWRYDVVSVGTKANLSDVSAAIALTQMSRIDELTRQRREVSSWYMQRLSNSPVRVLHERQRRAHLHAEHLMVGVLPESADRDEISLTLRNAEIASSMHFQSLSTLSFWREQIEKGRVEVCGSLEKSEAYTKSAISLPFYADMTHEQVDEVCDTLLNALG